MDNAINPIEFLNDLLGKVWAKNIFITFPIAPEEQGQALEKENKRVITIFSPAGKFIQNRYSEEAVKELAKAVDLEYRIKRTNQTNEAMLFRLDVVQQNFEAPSRRKAALEVNGTAIKKIAKKSVKKNK